MYNEIQTVMNNVQEDAINSNNKCMNDLNQIKLNLERKFTQNIIDMKKHLKEVSSQQLLQMKQKNDHLYEEITQEQMTNLNDLESFLWYFELVQILNQVGNCQVLYSYQSTPRNLYERKSEGGARGNKKSMILR